MPFQIFLSKFPSIDPSSADLHSNVCTTSSLIEFSPAQKFIRVATRTPSHTFHSPTRPFKVQLIRKQKFAAILSTNHKNEVRHTIFHRTALITTLLVMKWVPGVLWLHAVSRNFRPSQATSRYGWPEKPKRDQVRPPHRCDGGLWHEEELYASIRTRVIENIDQVLRFLSRICSRRDI